MYNTVIFDLDDTLTNDRENVKEARKTTNKKIFFYYIFGRRSRIHETT